jgi:HEAT repeat protein
MRYLILAALLLTRGATAATTESGAWQILTQGAAEENAVKRAQAVTAIGSIRMARAGKLVDAALSDKDSRVRLAAVSSLAERKSKTTIPQLKKALDDEAGEISFTAAQALWALGDRSGKDLLAEVLAGERKQSPGFIKQSVKDAKSTLHNRKALVWMGAKEGAGFLFGPLGYGLDVVEGMTKDSSAPARALSALLLGQEKTPEVIEALTGALDDKNPLVRIAAARALGGFANRSMIPKIEPLLEDKQEGVRYMAAASIVRLSQAK